MGISLLLLIATTVGMALARKPYRHTTLSRYPITIDERGRGYLESSPFRTGRPVLHFLQHPNPYHRNAL